jgi:phospholipase C
MNVRLRGATILGLTLSLPVLGALVSCCSSQTTLDGVETIVVLYAENRSFDNLYGFFPDANGLKDLPLNAYRQIDRDGTPLNELPPIWGGLTAADATETIPEKSTEHLTNAPFSIDDPDGRFKLPLSVATRDLVHRFYQNQMQINGGKNDRFVAYGDSGALVMGHYHGSNLKMWDVATRYVLADKFFMGAFGGSFMNHIYFACACVAYYPNADRSPAASAISKVENDKVSLKTVPGSSRSAMDGIPYFEGDGSLTPDFFAVNTMQPAYQPSRVKPPAGGDPNVADPRSGDVLVPQHDETIGDLLSAAGVTWAYFSGAWQATLEGTKYDPDPDFQYHHQPFNYFANYAPGTAARTEHLRDGGLYGAKFISAIDAGKLPQVTFYKPQGSLTQHAGYADVFAGDEHLAEVVAHLEKSPQWNKMVVIVTYDENGGFWDHVAPPKGDRWGPGTRIPAIIISPFVKRDLHVDHTFYDTGSILRFITRRFNLPMLAGLKTRDDATKAAGGVQPGDLTAALDLAAK